LFFQVVERRFEVDTRFFDSFALCALQDFFFSTSQRISVGHHILSLSRHGFSTRGQCGGNENAAEQDRCCRDLSMAAIMSHVINYTARS